MHEYSFQPMISEEVKRFHAKPGSRIKAVNTLVPR